MGNAIANFIGESYTKFIIVLTLGSIFVGAIIGVIFKILIGV